MNKVYLIGRLVAAPVEKTTAEGKTYAKCELQYREKRTDRRVTFSV